MALHVLKPGFRFVRGSGKATVVHTRTGDALEVSTEHGMLLELAASKGVETTDPLLIALVERYLALGILEASEVSAPAGQEEKASTPDEPVPCLRATLKVVPVASSSSLVSVSDPATGKTFQLYDFEVSLARMLNGRRKHSEVVAAAAQIGIPVTFNSLVSFIRELRRYGFIAPPGAEPPAGDSSLWPEREKWDEAVRTLFQSGLRMHRQGRYPESASYFEAMLVQDPKNAEALSMLSEARERIANPPVVMTPAVAATDGVPLEQFDELNLDDAPAGAPPAVPVAKVQPAAPVAVTAAAARPTRRAPVILAALVIAAVAGVGGWRLTSGARVPAVREPIAPARPLEVEVAGPVAIVAVRTQESEVDSGAIADTNAPTANAPTANAPTANAPTIAEPSATVEAGAGDIAWHVSAIAKRGRVKMGEVTASVGGTIAWKVASEQRVKKNDLVAVLQTAEGETRLVAAVQGLVVRTVAEGEQAKAGQPVADILYHEAYLQTVVTHERPTPQWRCEVVDEASHQRADCTVVTAVPKGAGFYVTAILLPRWFDAAVQPQLRLAPP